MKTLKKVAQNARCWTVVAGCFAAMVTCSGKAYAVSPTPYTVYDLAARKIAIQGFTAAQLDASKISSIVSSSTSGNVSVTQDCHLKFDQVAIVFDANVACPALWSQKEPATLTITIGNLADPLVLKGVRATDQLTLDFSQAKSPLVIVRDLPALTQAALYILGDEKPGDWIKVEPNTAGQITLDVNQWKRIRGTDYLRLVGLVDGQQRLIELHRNEITPPPPVDLPRPEQPPWDCDAELKAHAFTAGDSPVFCIDTTPDQQLTIAKLPKRQFIVPPNETIYVVVRTWDDNVPSVTMTGTVGLSAPKLNSQVTAQSGVPLEGTPVGHTTYATVWPMAPRASATTATVTVKLVKRADRATVVDQLPFDVAVDTVYYAALRLGIALGFGEFDHGYQAQKVGGSAVSEVVATANRDMNMEVVLGFAPYLDGIFSGKLHGRNYGSGFDIGLAPFVGIGIVSQGTNNLTAFRSFHAGAELEVGRNFSIAFTYVGRFVNELPAGVAVGSAVPDGTLSTHAALVSGYALVLNLSPEFFKFAGGSKL